MIIIDPEVGASALSNPAAIDGVQEWLGTKVQGAADVAPAAVILAVLYEHKRRILQALEMRVPRSVDRLVGEDPNA